jgi:hypothetical protein
MLKEFIKWLIKKDAWIFNALEDKPKEDKKTKKSMGGERQTL